jgi:uncharacterized damage-inducible protein DinB
MTVADFRRIYDYNYWANHRLFQALAPLTPEQFTQPVAGSYGSIRNTLVHMMSAEWGWFARCGGPPRGAALRADDYPTLASIVDRWTVVEREGRALLEALRDADLARQVEFTLPDLGARVMRIDQLLQHAANHGAHHRGQIALLMRVLGHPPGNVDLLIYDTAQADAATV